MQAVDTIVKLLLGIPTTHDEVVQFIAPFQSQLPANVHTGKQQVMVAQGLAIHVGDLEEFWATGS